MECCQFLTPALCFQKFRTTSDFEFFFTTLAIDGTIQESGKQFGGRCLESKETVAAQRLLACIFFVNERQNRKPRNRNGCGVFPLFAMVSPSPKT